MSGTDVLSELIERLRQLSNDGISPSQNITQMLRQAERWLQLIRLVDFSSAYNSAGEEFRYCLA